MELPTLSHIPDEELKIKLKSLRQNEREAIAEMVLYLSEIDRRGSFRDMGYSSLFVYCTEGLGYSAAGAHRRVQAARILKELPQVYEKLRLGVLTLCTVAEVSRVKEPEVWVELLQVSEGKGKDEVRSLVLKHLPAEKVKASTVEVKRVVLDRDPLFSAPASSDPSTPQTEERYTIKLEVEPGFMKLYEEALSILGGPMVEVFRKALQCFCDKRSPIRREKRREVRDSKPPVSKNRTIPIPVRDKIFLRDGSRCTYVAPDGTRCKETHRLEIDHIRPFGMGGGNEIQNLRLLCRSHNQLMAERVYGPGVKLFYQQGSTAGN